MISNGLTVENIGSCSSSYSSFLSAGSCCEINGPFWMLRQPIKPQYDVYVREKRFLYLAGNKLKWK